MNRTTALNLISQYIKNERMIAHCLASEAVMRKLAIRFNEDEEKWGLAGLLHDIDVEITAGDPKSHGLKSAEILSEEGYDDEIIDAIVRHNEECTDLKRSTTLHHALAAGETITGLITATTMVYPDKKIASVKSSSVVKRMKEKHFAASVKRENILECEKIGIPIHEFAEICTNVMKEIAQDIGL